MVAVNMINGGAKSEKRRGERQKRAKRRQKAGIIAA